MLKKIILIIITIIITINISFAKKSDFQKIKEKIQNTEYEKLIPKIDNFVSKAKNKNLEKLYTRLEKIDFKKPRYEKSKYILAYLKIKVYKKIKLNKSKKEKLKKENGESFLLSKNYNGLDISGKIKYKHIQEMPLSCEISAASDILTYLSSKKVKESELLKILDKSEFNKFPTKQKNGEKIWGNPQKGFVGYINKLPNGKKANQAYMTGYGVLEKPINKIYKSYGFETKIHTNGKISELLEEIHKGNMVQLWGDICTNPKYYSGKETICRYSGRLLWADKREIKWKYKDENGELKIYKGLNGEHAFYLLGYKGNYKKPTHIIVWDTMTGKHTYPTNEWMRKWDKMQNRSIIIYAK